jgi:hypothetical protein
MSTAISQRSGNGRQAKVASCFTTDGLHRFSTPKPTQVLLRPQYQFADA